MHKSWSRKWCLIPSHATNNGDSWFIVCSAFWRLLLLDPGCAFTLCSPLSHLTMTYGVRQTTDSCCIILVLWSVHSNCHLGQDLWFALIEASTILYDCYSHMFFFGTTTYFQVFYSIIWFCRSAEVSSITEHHKRKQGVQQSRIASPLSSTHDSQTSIMISIRG